MIVYTMGFTQKDSRTFFELIKQNSIEVLIDIRLNNKSQLAGFTKGHDLEYFLLEICNCKYSHEISFAPTKDILDAYKKKEIDWSKYTELYNSLIAKRKAEVLFEKRYGLYDRVLLLCSEPSPEQCHRRLFAEYLRTKLGYEIVHL